jgi:hypothetical protein
MIEHISRPAVASKDARLLRRVPPPRSYTLILLGLLAFTAAVTVLLFHIKREMSESAPQPAIQRPSQKKM